MKEKKLTKLLLKRQNKLSKKENKTMDVVENKEVAEKNEQVKLSPPWVTFYREIQALFEPDPEITVRYNEDGPEVKLFVRNGRKADALTRLLPIEKAFGNITLRITVIPENLGEENILGEFQDAFAGNPVLSYATQARLPDGEIVGFLMFKNCVVQFFNDNLSDLYGNRSTIYQDIAMDVFGGQNGLNFNTDLEGNPGHPLMKEKEE